MQGPKLLSTSVEGETFAGVTYHLHGELVPVLTIELRNTGIYFEHHILLWKNISIDIGIKAMKGMLKRMIAGMQIFVTEATGSGKIAFSRDNAGHILPIHLKRGQELHVREHQFLAATNSIDYTYEMVSGISNILMGGTGFFIDKFYCTENEGILWLHGYGNVFEVVLEAGEQIDIEPSGWLYKDPSVRMDTNFAKLTTGLFGGANLAMNRFTGPGRIGIQSMYANGLLADVGKGEPPSIMNMITGALSR